MLLPSVDPMLKLLLLQLVNLAISVVDLFTGTLFGWTLTRGRKEEEQRARHDYEKSAQIVTVVARQGRAKFLHFDHLNQVREKNLFVSILIQNEAALPSS